MQWPQKITKFMLNIYRPFLGAGIKVTYISDDWQEIHVAMKLKWYNRNAAGTHFGGSLYSMIDPHLLIMLKQLLGNGYEIWDKAASIEFVNPGEGKVRAAIKISDTELIEIKRQTEHKEKFFPEFDIRILDAQNSVVAVIKKVLYIQKKDKELS